jgi:hypothetical protein
MSLHPKNLIPRADYSFLTTLEQSYSTLEFHIRAALEWSRVMSNTLLIWVVVSQSYNFLPHTMSHRRSHTFEIIYYSVL